MNQLFDSGRGEGLFSGILKTILFSLTSADDLIDDAPMDELYRVIENSTSYATAAAIPMAARFDKYFHFKAFSTVDANGLASDKLSKLDLDCIENLSNSYIARALFGKIGDVVKYYGKFTPHDIDRWKTTHTKNLHEVRFGKTLKRISDLVNDSAANRIIKRGYIRNSNRFCSSDTPMNTIMSNYNMWCLSNIVHHAFSMALYQSQYSNMVYPSYMMIEIISALRWWLILFTRRNISDDMYIRYIADDSDEKIRSDIAGMIGSDKDDNLKMLAAMSAIYVELTNRAVNLNTTRRTSTNRMNSKFEVTDLDILGQFAVYSKSVLSALELSHGDVISKITSSLSDFINIKEVSPIYLTISTKNPYNMIFSNYGWDEYNPSWLENVVIPAIRDVRANDLPDGRGYLDELSYISIVEYTFSELSNNFRSNADEYDGSRTVLNEATANVLEGMHLAIVPSTDLMKIAMIDSIQKVNLLNPLKNTATCVIQDAAILGIINLHIKDDRSTKNANPLTVYSTYLTAISHAIYKYISGEMSGDSSSELVNLLNIGALMNYRCGKIPVSLFQKEGGILPTKLFSTSPAVGNEKFTTIPAYAIEMSKIIKDRANARNDETKLLPMNLTQYGKFISYISNALLNNTVSAEYIITYISSIYNHDILLSLGLLDSSIGGDINSRHIFTDIVTNILKGVGDRTGEFFELYANPVKILSTIWADSYQKEEEIDSSRFGSGITEDSPAPKNSIGKSIRSIEQHLEAVTFISILQMICGYNQMNEETLPEVINYGNLLEMVSPWEPCSNGMGSIGNAPGVSFRSKVGGEHRSASVLLEMQNAVEKFDAVVSQNLNRPDWVESHRHSVTKG